MSEREDLIESVKKDISRLDDLLNYIKAVDETADNIQERKKEAEAELLFLELAPTDYIAEISPTILPFQKYTEIRYSNLVNNFRNATDALVTVVSSSGSPSMYETAFREITALSGQDPTPPWIQPINDSFTSIAKYKTRKTSLPPKLDKINNDLGKKFLVAIRTVEKAQRRISGVDQAAIHMRDILQSAWGGVADIVKKNYPRPPKSINFTNPAFKKPEHRRYVAECLGKDDIQKRRFNKLLDDMFSLSKALSVTDFGKNPLSDDHVKLDQLFTSWLLEIDELASLVEID